MKKIIIIVLAIFSFQLDVKAQSDLSPEIETGLGIVFRHQEKFSAVRLALGGRNLILKNKLGFYYVLEYRGGIEFQEDNTNYYFRDVFGVVFSINKSFSVRAGAGLLRKGILAGSTDNDGRLRKEIAITYQIPQYPISLDLGFSVWVGPTATFRYILPLNK
jgi:hypothetical protein